MPSCISQGTEELYSFDIFDTLVTRRVATPDGIFAIIQNILIHKTTFNDFIKNNFYKIRIEAENLARQNARYSDKTYEITFDDIYTLIQNNYNLTDEEVDFLKNLEITTEINNIVPIKNNIEILKHLLEKNKRIILISDMYLSSKILKEILCNIDRIFENIKIYVSSEYKVSKGNKGLYEIIKSEESVEYKNWTHYGDNRFADIKNASKLGIKTNYCPQAKRMPYENELLNQHQDNVYLQGIAGCARLTRIFNGKQNDKFNFGASFGAPILYNYVEYCIEQSLQRGFKTLYFVARDGYILKLIADIIIKKKQLNIKTKYIYGSRLAWRIPTEENFDNFIYITLSEFKKQLSTELLAYRLGVEPDELGKLLNISDLSKPINDNLREQISEKIKTTTEIRNRIIEANKSKKELLTEYFKQEIDFNQKDIVFVDANGTGRTQDIIAPILNEISECNIYGFYFTNPAMIKNNKSIKLCYGIHKPYYYALELLCRAKEGQTTGYKTENGKIIPITEEGIQNALTQWGIDDYFEGVLTYVNNIIDFETVNNIQVNNFLLYCIYHNYLIFNLDKKTAKILGDIPFSMIGEEKNIKISSPRISPAKLLLMYICGENITDYTTFPFISIARSGGLTQCIYKFIERHPDFKKFIFNFVFDKYDKNAYLEILGIRISFSHYLRHQKQRGANK